MKQMLALRLCLFFAFFMSKANVNGQNYFTQDTVFPGLINQTSVDWGDFDNDNDLDLITTGQNSSSGLLPELRLYKNNGQGQFLLIPLQPQDTLYSAIARFADIDNDGDLDISYSGNTSPIITLGGRIILGLINNNGQFNQQLTIASLIEGNHSWGDMDNDNDLDLVVGSGSIGALEVRVVRNNGNNTFTLLPGNLAYMRLSDVKWVDIDGDGYLDVCASGRSDTLAVYHTNIIRNNSGNGTFSPVYQLAPISGTSSWADMDNDGDADLMLTGIHNYADPISSIYRNDGNFVLTSLSLNLPGINAYCEWFDYDQDNDMDVLVNGISGTYPNNLYTAIGLITNNGNNNFSYTQINPPLTSHYGSVKAGDYDGDGYPDFAISGPDVMNSSNKTIKIYHNNLATGINNTVFTATGHPAVLQNPAETVLNLNNGNCKNERYCIIDSRGRVVLQGKTANTETTSINISELVQGIYIINFPGKGLNLKFIRN